MNKNALYITPDRKLNLLELFILF